MIYIYECKLCSMSRCEVLHSAPSLHVLSVVVFVIRARFFLNKI